ncbi:hypothetical protein WG908_09745 [Sphingobium sp. AN641]|uniref:hypothetical protein n=1 Tax=Sphingobium sp. AN641 TaxID=3133443 RepID=UPI0030C3122C
MRRPPDLLDTPLLQLTTDDTATIRDFCSGTLCTGMTGSGKTSGPAATILRAFLRAGMGGVVMGEPRARRAVPWKPIIAVLFVMAVFANALANPVRQSATAGAGMLVITLGLGLVAVVIRSLVRLWRRRPRRRAIDRDVPVTICARPVVLLPPLRDAYAALPDYCWQVLGR